MNKVGLAIIGCGPMGTGLAKAAREIEDIEIVAVSDADGEKAMPLARECDVPFDTDYRPTLDRAEVDAVVVAVPQFLHAEVAVAAAQRGKHVFCEKPMATSVADCDRMIEACRNAAVKLMIGQVCRYHAVHSKVKEIVDSGELGKPTCMFVRRLGGGWGQGSWARPWRLSMAQSGGILMEINAHEIDFMRFVCGDAKRVFAAGGIYRQKEADYPDIVLLAINFASGAVGMLHASQASAIGSYGGRLDCENGTIDFPAIWGQGAGVTYQCFGCEPVHIPLGDIRVENPVQHEIRAFADAILNDTEPEIPGSEGRAAVQIAEAAYRSIETGQPVELAQEN